MKKVIVMAGTRFVSSNTGRLSAEYPDALQVTIPQARLIMERLGGPIGDVVAIERYGYDDEKVVLTA